MAILKINYPVQFRWATSPAKVEALLGRNRIMYLFCIFLLLCRGPRSVLAPQWLPAQGPHYLLIPTELGLLALSEETTWLPAQPRLGLLQAPSAFPQPGLQWQGQGMWIQLDERYGKRPQSHLPNWNRANRFIIGTCCFDYIDFNDIIKWSLVAQ